MRKTALACLALGLLLQTGCSLTPKMTTVKKEKPSPQKASKYLSAEQFENQGKFERARELYQEMLDSDPKNPDYMHRLAIVCTRLQRYGEANSLYARAYELDSKNPNLITDMGYSEYLRGDYVESERLLRESLHLNPNSKRTVSNLALAMGRQGKLGESLFLLRQVGDEKSALTGLAYIYSERGENELAEERYREALAIDPEWKDAQRGLAEIGKRKRPDASTTDGSAIAAKSPGTTTKSATPADLPESVAVQQVQAIEESVSQIETASFVDEPTTSSVPAMLSEQDAHALPASRATRTRQIDDVASSTDDFAGISESAAVEQTSSTGRWDAAEPDAETTPANAPSFVPAIFETGWDETPSGDQASTAAPVETATAPAVPRLTFVATKSANRQPKIEIEEESLNLDDDWDSEK